MNQIAVKSETAAKMLDMTPDEFRALVADGALPGPVRIGDKERWLCDTLRAILRGDAAKPDEDFDL
ncbi:hypothetical protein KU6B_48210 [Mameliella alba]|uniref:hypothetical protein n=1 Tax=Mameliella alba TaxID=561184 RepID=UPI0013E4AF16|nr:hypothetical protein [Mameliella alba]BBU58556.1 hypothetical protein KU6B_48210 [Mameliella alba]